MRVTDTYLRADFVLVFIVSVTIACEGPMIFECIPISAIWKSERPASANCISREAFNDIGIVNGSELSVLCPRCTETYH